MKTQINSTTISKGKATVPFCPPPTPAPPLSTSVSACRGRLSDKAKTWPARGHVYRSARHMQDTNCVPCAHRQARSTPTLIGEGQRSCSTWQGKSISIFAPCISWIAFKQHLCIFNVTTEMMRHSRRHHIHAYMQHTFTFAPPRLVLTLGIRCIEKGQQRIHMRIVLPLMQFVVLWNFTNSVTALNALVEPRQAVNQRIMCGNLWVQQVFDIQLSLLHSISLKAA